MTEITDTIWPRGWWWLSRTDIPFLFTYGYFLNCAVSDELSPE